LIFKGTIEKDLPYVIAQIAMEVQERMKAEKFGDGSREGYRLIKAVAHPWPLKGNQRA
jgi:hypothetical protein